MPPSRSCLPQTSPAARSCRSMAVPVLARCLPSRVHQARTGSSAAYLRKGKFAATRSRRRLLWHVCNTRRAGSRSPSVAVTPRCPRVAHGAVPCRFGAPGGNTLSPFAPRACRFLLSLTCRRRVSTSLSLQVRGADPVCIERVRQPDSARLTAINRRNRMREPEAMIESPEAKGEDPDRRVPDSRLPCLCAVGTEHAFGVGLLRDTEPAWCRIPDPDLPMTEDGHGFLAATGQDRAVSSSRFRNFPATGTHRSGPAGTTADRPDAAS